MSKKTSMRVAFRSENNDKIEYAEKIEFSSGSTSFFAADGSLIAISPTAALISICLDARQLTRNEIITKTTSDILEGNARTYAVTSSYIRRTFATAYVMHVTLFIVGIAAFVAAIARGITAQDLTETISTAIFGGLSAASFATLFLSRPVNAISREGLRLSWLVAILNTYWTRLSYFDDMKTIDDDLVRAEADLVRRLTEYSSQVGGREGSESTEGSGRQGKHPIPKEDS